MSFGRIDDEQITTWALAAGAGDQVAVAAFIRATQGDVYRFVTYLVGAGDAEDLTQETLLRAVRALPRFAAQSTARTWLLAIARRVAADHIRALRRRPRLAGAVDWQPGVEQNPDEHRFDEYAALLDLVAGLDPDRREAFVATQVLGLSYAEAALVCDCPVGTIRSRVARARDDLVTALDADDQRSARRSRLSG
ncbi:sigma-70 family RNA polymerase sigma factor [Longispora sp. K20-0274]|uniref:sigma-70 family RNA polymerase sigma factor n=1 Tax=Longispora sp. K20-0274 TaxID=3088255 RepID=UPI003999E74F